jgi:hypothetical protein
MTVKTLGQLRGEHVVQLVDADRGDFCLDKITFASGHGTVEDGTVMKDDGTGKAVPAAGTVDTAGDSDEAVIGTAFGKYDTTAAIAGVIVARAAVVDTTKIVAPGNKAALVAALKKLFIIAR